MDPVSIWLIILVALPFILFLCRNTRNSIKPSVTPWPSFEMDSNKNTFSPPFYDPMLPITEYPSYSTSSDNGAVVAYIVSSFVLIIMACTLKIIISQRRRNARAERMAARRNQRARQVPLSTISCAVDANRIGSQNTASDSTTADDAQIKVDLPPTYEEVMKAFADSKEAAASSQSNETATHDSHTNPTNNIDIEDPTLPQCSRIQ